MVFKSVKVLKEKTKKLIKSESYYGDRTTKYNEKLVKFK
jgi:hypothetical protein